MKPLSSLQILQKLVSFDTVSSKSNLDLIVWIEQYLASYGITSQRIDWADDNSNIETTNSIKSTDINNKTGKCSLIARIGANQSDGLVFSGHTDVVPVIGQPWSQDPFSLWQTDERYYGRGTCDMKGFIACVLSLVPKWSKLTLKKPIYLAFTRDEEIGCLGATAMAEFLSNNVTTATTATTISSINNNDKGTDTKKPMVIIGEPTLMQPVVAQKGITSYVTTVYGKAAHSSQVNQGISAVHVASRLIYEIENIMQAMVTDGMVDHGFNIPFSSLHVGKINGGTAINVKARECIFEWEIRHLPSQTVNDIMSRVEYVIDGLKRELVGLEINTVQLSPTVPALENSNNETIVNVVKTYLPADANLQYVAYATEAGIYQKHGFEVVILGPGSIEQAHQPDEWVEAKQIKACSMFLDKLVAGYCL